MRGFGWLALCLTCLAAAAAPGAADEPAARRPLEIGDLFRIATPSEPQISPDGKWVAYTVERHDLDKDEARSRLWMVPAEGGEAIPLTQEASSAWHPRFSPDGRWLAFLSDRPGRTEKQKTQVWRLHLGGGEAEQLTDFIQAVSGFEFSPDGRRLVLRMRDPSPEQQAASAAREKGEPPPEEKPRPWVIDRLQIKDDSSGYLDERRAHLYLFDVASRQSRQLTSGPWDDAEPAWSPDGRWIAFTSNRTEDPDANYNTDLWLVASEATDGGRTLVRLTSNPGPDEAPAWSPDGGRLVYRAATDVEAMLYATVHLATVSVAGGDERLLSAALDRNVLSPAFAPDGSILALIEEAGEQALARFSPAGGAPARLVRGQDVVESGFDVGPAGEVAAAVWRPQAPSEIFLWKPPARRSTGGTLSQLSRLHDELLAGLSLGEVRKLAATSPDGTPVEYFLVTPPGFREGPRYPAVLWLHGGPQAQYDWRFDFEPQIFAAHGYVVVLPNPRGSTGYGQAFCLGIWRVWGGPDTSDVLAAMDDAIARGFADPERLAVGGWSYGGMLTDHVIVQTDRFEAAMAGASAALYTSNYGTDQYQQWWERELDLPWRSRALWDELSPFFSAEKVTTPTLFIGGEKDWNVPTLNSEQFYQALKRLGKDTELVVYPDENHSIDRPSFLRDRLERYLAWFDRWVLGEE